MGNGNVLPFEDQVINAHGKGEGKAWKDGEERGKRIKERGKGEGRREKGEGRREKRKGREKGG